MRSISLLALALLLTIPTTTQAAGSDHRIDQIGRSTGWKPGYYEVIKQPNLVHGYWINTFDVFFFKGFNEDLIKQLNELEKIEGFKTEVIIHAKLGVAKSPWKDARIVNYADWSLTTYGSFSKDRKNDLTIDIYLGGDLQLEDLEIPQSFTVKSAGDIEEFIQLHNKK